MRTVEIDLAVYEELIRQSEQLDIIKKFVAAEDKRYIDGQPLRGVLGISAMASPETWENKND